ncbi:hypothetical protein [Microcystis phage Me-ZS1]|nr:hypothetical protein [Microcystis phage Me-ZS1]
MSNWTKQEAEAAAELLVFGLLAKHGNPEHFRSGELDAEGSRFWTDAGVLFVVRVGRDYIGSAYIVFLDIGYGEGDIATIVELYRHATNS